MTETRQIDSVRPPEEPHTLRFGLTVNGVTLATHPHMLDSYAYEQASAVLCREIAEGEAERILASWVPAIAKMIEGVMR